MNELTGLFLRFQYGFHRHCAVERRFQQFRNGVPNLQERNSAIQEQLNQFSQRFAQPETFRPEELENAFWMEFHTF